MHRWPCNWKLKAKCAFQSFLVTHTHTNSFLMYEIIPTAFLQCTPHPFTGFLLAEKESSRLMMNQPTQQQVGTFRWTPSAALKPNSLSCAEGRFSRDVRRGGQKGASVKRRAMETARRGGIAEPSIGTRCEWGASAGGGEHSRGFPRNFQSIKKKESAKKMLNKSTAVSLLHRTRI